MDPIQLHVPRPSANYYDQARIDHRRAFVLHYTIAGFDLATILKMYNEEIEHVDPSFRVALSTIRADRMAVLRDLRSKQEQDAVLYQNLLIERYNVVLRALYPAVKDGNLGAIDRWLRTNEQIGYITGANAPIKVEVEDTGKLTPEERRARVLALMERAMERAAPPAEPAPVMQAPPLPHGGEVWDG